MQQFVPDIGSSGLFSLGAPFDNALTANVSYTCIAIRGLNEVTAAGEDTYDVYYLPRQITKEVYNTHVTAGVYLITLQSGTGSIVYVPSVYILSAPNVSGVKYGTVMLGVSLGALADNVSLEALKTSITNLVRDTLGVTPTLKAMVVSQASLISQTDHEAIEKSDYARLREMTIQRDTALETIAQLNAYILEHITP
jgi:hypothetical protein